MDSAGCSAGFQRFAPGHVTSALRYYGLRDPESGLRAEQVAALSALLVFGTQHHCSSRALQSTLLGTGYIRMGFLGFRFPLSRGYLMSCYFRYY
jgi:hypothetical protein